MPYTVDRTHFVPTRGNQVLQKTCEKQKEGGEAQGLADQQSNPAALGSIPGIPEFWKRKKKEENFNVAEAN